MITLYHASGARSCRVRWLLEELEVPYRLENLSFTDGSMRRPEYLAIHPLGRVPAIDEDGSVLFESGAIVEHLLEKHGEGRLAPAPGTPERAAFLQWLHFAEATLLPPLGEIIQHTFLRPESERIAALVPDAKRRFREALQVLEDHLEGRQFLVGDAFSAADIMAGYVVKLAALTGQLEERFPRCHAYLERLSQRPACEKAFS